VERLTFFAGKGGVGKTTCASSLALQVAKNKRCTVISVDPAHTLRDVFAHEAPPKNLTVETIDTREKPSATKSSARCRRLRRRG
jgi:arsenite-transporting ATPase